MQARKTSTGAATTAANKKPDEQKALPTLTLMADGMGVREFSLDRPYFRIGRAADNDLSIPSPYVSQHHILLIRRDGATILVDLNSTNGTFVNSERVDRHVLANDDVIEIDQQGRIVTYSIKYCDPSTASAATVKDDDPIDPVIEKALAQFENLLVGGDTDLLPTLSEDVPTIVAFVDDR
jgi:pSer/pThr/pTyr-binding forkhead associated (FHA) protein